VRIIVTLSAGSPPVVRHLSNEPDHRRRRADHCVFCPQHESRGRRGERRHDRQSKRWLSKHDRDDTPLLQCRVQRRTLDSSRRYSSRRHMLDFELARVTAARAVRAHVVWLEFSDGLEGEVDLADGLNGEMLEPLRDPALFAQLRAEDGTIVWPNGADWAPETLYERLRAARGIDPRSDDDERERARAYVSAMPEVSRFFGMVIRMLANEHDSQVVRCVSCSSGATRTRLSCSTTGSECGRVSLPSRFRHWCDRRDEKSPVRHRDDSRTYPSSASIPYTPTPSTLSRNRLATSTDTAALCAAGFSASPTPRGSAASWP
jgi:hypothetical protein